jgi:hypothetical protein
MPAPRRNVCSTPDGGPAVQPPGHSYTAHWEALGCALYLLTTPEILSTGPVRGQGFCPGSHGPRARVPLAVWAWDFLLCGFLAAVSRPQLSHCFSLCDLRLFVNKLILLPFAPICSISKKFAKRNLPPSRVSSQARATALGVCSRHPFLISRGARERMCIE